MRVQQVLMPDSTTESWTLLGNDLQPVAPVESFLAYLSAIERSPNTVKAYAHDLKDWWCGCRTGHPRHATWVYSCINPSSRSRRRT